MSLEHSYEILAVSIGEAITLCPGGATPIGIRGSAGEPAHDTVSQTPKTDEDQKAQAKPSHTSSLEDAKVL